ncbi:MAG: hypothetical protein Q9190_000195 [Brigantiaea leucoxantha]
MEHPSDLAHIGGLSGKSDQSSDMDDALAIVGKMVKGFLATRPATPSSRADVVFDQVSVEGNGKGVQAAPTISTAVMSFLNIFNPMTYRTIPSPSRTLLRDFSGTIGTGEMLLVIGRPGSGCTTFLKTLANMRGEYKSTSGDVTYGGRSAKEMAQGSMAEIAFCGASNLSKPLPSSLFSKDTTAEDDDHFPTLTVEETLR